MTPERIAELRALAEQATPGPWRFSGTSDLTPKGWISTPQDDICDLTGAGAPHDAAFIAAARTALPEALDAIERVRKLCETESYTDYEWRGPHGAGVQTLITDMVLAALEGRKP